MPYYPVVGQYQCPTGVTKTSKRYTLIRQGDLDYLHHINNQLTCRIQDLETRMGLLENAGGDACTDPPAIAEILACENRNECCDTPQNTCIPCA